MKFGKRTTYESYFNDEIVGKKVTYSEPIRVQTKSQALDELMKGLDVVANGKTDEVTLQITCDKKTRNIRMITKTYTVDE